MKNEGHIQNKVNETLDLLDQIKPVKGSDLFIDKMKKSADAYLDKQHNNGYWYLKSFKPFAAAAVLIVLFNAAFVVYMNTNLQLTETTESLDDYMDSFYNHYSSTNTSNYYELLQE